MVLMVQGKSPSGVTWSTIEPIHRKRRGHYEGRFTDGHHVFVTGIECESREGAIRCANECVRSRISPASPSCEANAMSASLQVLNRARTVYGKAAGV